MTYAVFFVLVVLGAGHSILRGLGLAKGAGGIGLAPAVGLAALAVVSTWCAAFSAPAPTAGLLCLGLALGGAAVAFGDRHALATLAGSVVRDHHRVAALLVGASLLVPTVVMSVAFQGVEAPLSTHDGAFHVEVIDGLRRGGALAGWYPPGLEAVFAAMLQLLPWLDSAAGSFDVALGLSILAPLAVFGLGVVLWRDLTIAGLAALLSSLTYLFTYFAQIWSGWPLETSTLLLLGLWVLGLEYVHRPDWRWSIPGGLMLGAVVLTHGSELISAAIVLLVVLIGHWACVRWRATAVHAGVAIGVAALCAAPYVPALFNWAASGGATAVGYAQSTGLDTAALATVGGEPLRVYALDAIGIDLPIRLVLIAFGVYWIVRERAGRSVLVVAALFTGFALAFAALIGIPLVRQIFAISFPWGLHYRLFMMLAVALALIAGAGGVSIGRALSARRRRIASQHVQARLLRIGRVGLVAWLVLSTWATEAFVSIPAAAVSSFSADDAAAMDWLRQNSVPDALLANDGFADAGIWAPYKAGLAVLVPRSSIDARTADLRALVLQNVDRLDQVPAAAAAACRLNVQYVYYGAKNTAWQARSFVTAGELRISPALEVVFAHGDAVVLRTRLRCD